MRAAPQPTGEGTNAAEGERFKSGAGTVTGLAAANGAGVVEDGSRHGHAVAIREAKARCCTACLRLRSSATRCEHSTHKGPGVLIPLHAPSSKRPTTRHVPACSHPTLCRVLARSRR